MNIPNHPVIKDRWQSHDGSIILLRGDCLEILPLLPKVDCVCTDPPYGIGRDGQRESTGIHGGRKQYDAQGWDNERPRKAVFDMMLSMSEKQVIWGGNYFADYLPATGKWLVWDKGQRINQSDGELAWTSEGGALRIYTLNRVAIMKDGAEHPTQKPVDLIKWCMSEIDAGKTILDPFMGGGSTGRACIRTGRAFVGIELNEINFNIAVKRCDAESRQMRMFP